MNTHSKEKAPAKKLIDNIKINELEFLKAGTEKTTAVIKPKDNIVAISCKMKKAWTLLDSFSLSSLTLTHSLTAKFGMPIFAKIRK